ncbi:FAD-dependent monooxygenase [Pseudochryseolinea flava]|uniref:Monooxygenase n=1 Tax=Pseudochryseolinea flava TaxID=2059302 RepID=A0A364XTR2_9BACT|nr:FAD-dependent monooxygenase [Pseudochryseolinea flava]RAV97741.1 monooxygenase [Pseudochryseolinea flava]
MTKWPTFAIVGGGIGGLTLAIAMQRQGYQVKVYESANDIKPLGAGIMLAANAIKALSEIGIAENIIAKGKVLQKLIIKDNHGKVLNETSSDSIRERYGLINNFTIHRADLHEVLLKLLHPDTLVLAKACTDFQQTKDGVDLFFQDGSTAHADYVIASDGIHSVFRKKLLPESQPRYAGYTCWRAVIDNLPAEFNFEETVESWGAGSRFGIVPLSGKRLYWFATLNARQNDPAKRNYKVEDLLREFSEFYDPVAKIISHTNNDQIIWSDIIDLAPIKKFAFNNLVLMGDAAHATTPNMGQGACMAIEDAAVLANCLDEYSSPEEAFYNFEKQRIARTTRIVNTSWRLGRVAQLQNPILAKLRNAAMRFTPQSVSEKQFKFLYEVEF